MIYGVWFPAMNANTIWFDVKKNQTIPFLWQQLCGYRKNFRSRVSPLGNCSWIAFKSFSFVARLCKTVFQRHIQIQVLYLYYGMFKYMVCLPSSVCWWNSQCQRIYCHPKTQAMQTQAVQTVQTQYFFSYSCCCIYFWLAYVLVLGHLFENPGNFSGS